MRTVPAVWKGKTNRGIGPSLFRHDVQAQTKCPADLRVKRSPVQSYSDQEGNRNLTHRKQEWEGKGGRHNKIRILSSAGTLLYVNLQSLNLNHSLTKKL